MLKTLFASLLIGSVAFFSTAVSAQAPAPSPYANEACKSGCVFLERDHYVYSGAQVRTYRVCANNFSINVIVDGRKIPIASGFCADVSGQTIQIDGVSARAGLLPN